LQRLQGMPLAEAVERPVQGYEFFQIKEGPIWLQLE
jgi:hypothetical protein